MLIWTPLGAAELQKSMHEASLGPAALIPVQSGTVLLFSPKSRQVDALGVVMKARKAADTSAVMAVWNEETAIVYPAVGRVSRGWVWGRLDQVLPLMNEANQHGWFGRWFQRTFARFFDAREREKTQATFLERFAAVAPQADLDVVAGLLRAYEDGAGLVAKLFVALGLPDVAKVAGLVEEGRADQWLATLTAPRLPRWFERGYMLLSLAAVVLMFAVTTPLWVKFALLALILSFFGVSGLIRRAVVGRKPINTVLPVIPVTQGAAPTD
jgi:hypothetical protein